MPVAKRINNGLTIRQQDRRRKATSGKRRGSIIVLTFLLASRDVRPPTTHLPGVILSLGLRCNVDRNVGNPASGFGL